jgi:hypothetical protein
MRYGDYSDYDLSINIFKRQDRLYHFENNERYYTENAHTLGTDYLFYNNSFF